MTHGQRGLSLTIGIISLCIALACGVCHSSTCLLQRNKASPWTEVSLLQVSSSRSESFHASLGRLSDEVLPQTAIPYTASPYEDMGTGSCLNGDDSVGSIKTSTSSGPHTMCQAECDANSTCAGYDSRKTGCVFYHNVQITHTSGGSVGFRCYRKPLGRVSRTVRVELLLAMSLKEIHDSVARGPISKWELVDSALDILSGEERYRSTLSMFTDVLKTELSRASGIASSRLHMLDLRGQGLTLNMAQLNAGHLVDTLLLGISTAAASNVSADDEASFNTTRVDIEVLPVDPSADDAEPTPIEVTTAWRAQLAEPASVLRSGQLAEYLAGASLTVSPGLPVVSVTVAPFGKSLAMRCQSSSVLLLPALLLSSLALL